MDIEILFGGFPGRSNRGFLGWSSCVLIRMNGQRPVLFDTGGFNERYVLQDKLYEFGISTNDVGSIFLSHFHFDHAVNYGLFKNAVVYLHEEEAKYVESHGCEDLAIPVEMFESLQASGRLFLLSGTSGQSAGIKWLATPGHTPGSLSLLLEHLGQRWALAADAVKNRLELLTGNTTMTLDQENSRRSIEAIQTWADIVVPGHDAVLTVSRDKGKLQVNAISSTRVEVMAPVSNKNKVSYVLSTDEIWSSNF